MILVTGASGTNGIELIKLLSQDGVSPRRFTRGGKTPRWGWILNGLSLGEASRTILFAALRCQFLQYAVNPQDNLFEFFQFARLFFTRQDRDCDFAA